MKKLLLFLLLLAGVTFAQTNGKAIGNASVWTDSLGYGVVATSDSVWILKTDFANTWYRLFIKGNANSPVDSIYAQVGSIRYRESGQAVDTVWGSWSTVKDSVWESANTMVNNSVGKDFTLYVPAVQLLKLSLLNHRATLVTRNVVITINATRD